LSSAKKLERNHSQLYAGSRSAHLEREIGTITRKQARRLAEGNTEKMIVTPKSCADFWGCPSSARNGRSTKREASRSGGGPGVDACGGDICVHRGQPDAGGKQFTTTDIWAK